jgi:dTDP-4-dehydrorhamnose 3,5-epimerase
MIISSLSIPEVFLIESRRIGDSRGFFSETFRADKLAENGFDAPFVQDNHSRSAQTGTLRGLHYQRPPQAQDKLVRVIRGAILDVAVDIREGSPTYGQSVSAELTGENGLQILVPKGFAHGFVTLEPDTEVIYKVTDYYSPECDAGILWNDPDLAVDWKFSEEPVLSAKDIALPAFRDLPLGLFPYGTY